MAARVPGLPAVWNPTTGEGASFRSDSMPSGVVIREESPIGSLRAQITRNGVGFYAAKLWSKPEGGVAIGVSAAVPTIEQFDVILRSVRWAPETGWSIDLPAGWEAIPLSDQESTQTADTDGFYADLDVATMSVVRLDPVQRAGQLASVVSMGGTTRTTAPDGRTVYETTATSGYVSAYLPGTDGRPDISVSSERISVAAVVDIALSVQSVDDAEADVFFAGIQER